MIKLRKPNFADIEARQKLGRHPDVVRGFGVHIADFQEITRQEAETWVGEISQHPYAWIIESDGELIGLVRLDNVNLEDKRASLAIGIWAADRLGIGMGPKAVSACLKIAFKELGLHRVSVRVLASNTRAIRCYEKCGFKHEGIEREAAYIDGGFEDDVMMAVLAHEFVDG
jgi:RimJ/RimL family protein N-acetyltransferase